MKGILSKIKGRGDCKSVGFEPLMPDQGQHSRRSGPS